MKASHWISIVTLLLLGVACGESAPRQREGNDVGRGAPGDLTPVASDLGAAEIGDSVPPEDAPRDSADPAPDVFQDTTPPSGDVAFDGGADGHDASAPPFARVPQGDPVSAAQLGAVTDLYLELLRETRWFAVVEERAHGWPRSDPEQRFFYGTWWSGVRILKENGLVTYRHPPDGSDNNGLRTAPILNGVCFAHALWGGQESLLRTLVRGFESWALAMDRDDGADRGALLARAHYPESVLSEDGGRSVYIDYDPCRPGEEWSRPTPAPSIFVLNDQNPWWGEIWVKNIRSKDDIGHMLQALTYLPGCMEGASDAFQDDVARVMAAYEAWARRVEDDGWKIATVDEDYELYYPEGELAFYLMPGDIECLLALATRLFGRNEPGPVDCGDGITPLSEEWLLKNDFHQIQRSFQQAAAALAARHGHLALRDLMLRGLAWRIERILDAKELGAGYDGPHERDVAELIVMSANAGLPLTAREVRFLHERIAEAHESYLSEHMRRHYHVFDADTPDGEYAFTPEGSGFFFRLLAAALGTCASPWRHPDSEPVLDCERVRAAAPY